jgi:hypothetical protein
MGWAWFVVGIIVGWCVALWTKEMVEILTAMDVAEVEESWR